MNIKTALGNSMLNKHEYEKIDAEILLAHVLNKNRTFLYTNSDYLLNEQEQIVYEKMLNERIKGMPIAYLTNKKDFWNLSLKVNQHTLIPRSDTELLVELTLKLLQDQAKNPVKILELGTGSGAIALALAQERCNWHISACDISDDALLVAEQNALDLKIKNINFYKSNWFLNIATNQFDAIIANPPYIENNDEHLKRGDLRFEPLIALVSGTDGLDAITHIIKNSVNFLKEDGFLLLEHGYNQKESVSDKFLALQYQKIQSWQDLNNIDRVTGGYCPKNIY